MTYSTSNFDPAFRLGLVSELHGALAALTLRLLESRRARKTARLLTKLDDHVLRDIGLARDEIFAASRRAVMAGGHRIAR